MTIQTNGAYLVVQGKRFKGQVQSDKFQSLKSRKSKRVGVVPHYQPIAIGSLGQPRFTPHGSRFTRYASRRPFHIVPVTFYPLPFTVVCFLLEALQRLPGLLRSVETWIQFQRGLQRLLRFGGIVVFGLCHAIVILHGRFIG